MSNLRCWLPPSVLLCLFVASLAAQDAREEKIRETGRPSTKVRHAAEMLQFSGKQHLVIPRLRYDGSHPITFEALLTELYRGSIIGDFNGSGLGLDVANGYCSFHVNDGRASNNGYAFIKSRTSIGRGKPVHIAGVFDGKEMRLYVAGKLQGRESIGVFNKSKHPFMIGADPGGNGEPTQFLHGIIDKVRVSRKVRYHQDFVPPGQFESDKHTLVLYRFADRDGNSVVDASGNGLHARIVAGPDASVTADSTDSDLLERVERLEKEVGA